MKNKNIKPSNDIKLRIKEQTQNNRTWTSNLRRKKKNMNHQIKMHEHKQTQENPHENHTAVTLLKWVGNFNLTGWILPIAPCNNFQIQLTTTQLLKKVFKSQIQSSSWTVWSPQQHDAVSIHRSNTIISRF